MSWDQRTQVRESVWPFVGRLVLSAAFLAGGVALVLRGDLFFGVAAVAVMGLLTLTAADQLRRHRRPLMIDSEGIDNGPMGQRVAWRDVTEMRMHSYETPDSGTAYVLQIDVEDPARIVGKRPAELQQMFGQAESAQPWTMNVYLEHAKASADEVVALVRRYSGREVVDAGFGPGDVDEDVASDS